MTIKELETRTGLDRATVRFYEKEGLLTPERKANGYREYSEEDAVTLEKIAFLRRLDLSLESIRAVQQGELPLGVALEKQRESLLAQREEKERALSLCDAVRAEGIGYQNLQPGKYTAQLPPPRWTPRVIPPAPPPKHYATRHPWRRLLARELDMGLFRLPWWGVLSQLEINGWEFWLSHAVMLLVLPILLESMLLCTWGTTPGKWLMGLQLRQNYDGKLSKPTFRDAFTRTLYVYAAGCGFGIASGICYILSYLRANRGDDQPWDMWWEYTADEYISEGRVAVLLAALLAVNVAQNQLMNLWEDNVDEQAFRQGAYTPTLEEFVDSVNAVLAEYWMFDDYRHVSLNYDGTWNGLPEEMRAFDLTFQLEDGKFRKAMARAEFPGSMEGTRPDGMELYSAMMLGLHRARGYQWSEHGVLTAGSFREIENWQGDWGAAYRLESDVGLDEFFEIDFEGYRPKPEVDTPDLQIVITVGKRPY